MKNKTKIKTRHVYTEDNKVFLKNEHQEQFSEEVAEWFPIDFTWISLGM